jgi:hypothetical protein
VAEKKINGDVYKTEPLLASDAIRLQMRLVKAVGPALGQLTAMFSGAGADASAEAKEKSNVAAVQALANVVSALEPDEAVDLVKSIVEIAYVQAPSKEWRQVDLDGDFHGKLGEIIPVASFVLKEQFGDFFGAALASGRPALKGAH